MLRAGANPNVSMWGNLRALHVAGDRGHASIAALLLAAGADRDAVNDEGQTALDLARDANHVDVIEVLTREAS